MSRKSRAADRKPKVDISQTDELGLTGGARRANLAAWVLSGFVIVAGIVALVATGQKIFILFIVLGIITPLNVLAYDNLILKPKVARLKAEREKEAEAAARAAKTADAASPDESDGAKETDQ